MKVIVTESINDFRNETLYDIGEELEVVDMARFKKDYARVYEDTMDFIPKDKVKIVEEEC